MIIGTLCFDVQVEVTDEKALGELSQKIISAMNQIAGASEAEEVDSQVEEIEEESEAE